MPTKLLVWRQGSAHTCKGKTIISFDHEINAGPSDRKIKIAGFDVQPDEHGNFISDNYSEDELDAIHTFGISRYVLEIFEKELGKSILWSWENTGVKGPLIIYIRNNDINARYLKEAKCIQLDYFGLYENWTYYCRSVDIVAHEIGHAILDGIKPLWDKGPTETRGMAEAFCDLSAMFVITSQLDLCNEVLKQTRGDLQRKNMLSEFGIGYGFDNGGNAPIRSAINHTKYDPNHLFTYDFAEVLVACLYDLLCEVVKNTEQPQPLNGKVFFKIAQKWQSAIIRTFYKCNPTESSISEFQNLLINQMPHEKKLIIRLFQERNVPYYP